MEKGKQNNVVIRSCVALKRFPPTGRSSRQVDGNVAYSLIKLELIYTHHYCQDEDEKFNTSEIYCTCS